MPCPTALTSILTKKTLNDTIQCLIFLELQQLTKSQPQQQQQLITQVDDIAMERELIIKTGLMNIEVVIPTTKTRKAGQ